MTNPVCKILYYINIVEINSYWQDLTEKCRIMDIVKVCSIFYQRMLRPISVKIYNKLVRDKIPQIIEHSGKQAIIEVVSGKEYLELLNAKLGEELQEYLESESIEELADLIEVVYAILDYKTVSLQEFELIRKQKVTDRGAFIKRLLLKEVISS